MVTRLIISLWLAMLTASAWAQPQFSVTVDKHDIALGEAITVTIRAQDNSTPLDTLNLDALKTDFDIYTSSSSKQTELIKGKTTTTATTTLILYPMHGGQLQLPSFKLAGNASHPVAVMVRESGPDTPPVLFKPTLIPAHPLTRQTATLNLDIYDDGSLQWSPSTLPAPAGTSIRKLAESQWNTTLNGVAFTVHRLAWAIMPLNAGSVTLNFPMLNAIKFGNRLRYAAPSLQFNASPTPRYLPVYVPIGKLTVTSQLPSGELVLNRPVNWNLVVRGTGISAEGLAKLLPSMVDSAALHFYPPQIRLADENTKSPEQTLLVTLPFQPLRATTIQLPEIGLPYYNPATGVVESASLKSPQLIVVNPLWHAVEKLIVIVTLLGLLVWLMRISSRWYRHKRIRHASLHNIANATTPQQLRQALLSFDWGMGSLQAATLRLWLSKIDNSRNNNALTLLVDQLEMVCYRDEAKQCDWQALRQTAWQIMRVSNPV